MQDLTRAIRDKEDEISTLMNDLRELKEDKDSVRSLPISLSRPKAPTDDTCSFRETCKTCTSVTTTMPPSWKK